MVLTGAVAQPGGLPLDGTLANASDEALIRKAAEENDSGAFELFARRHTRSIYNLAMHLTSNRMMAEDVVQETLLGLWKSARTYEASKGSVRSWLLHIAAHTAIKMNTTRDREESRIRRRYARGESARQVALPEDKALEDHALTAALRRLVEQLSDLDRKLVALYYGGEVSQDEISRLLGVPQRTISRRLAVALRRLQEGMKRAGYASGVDVGGCLGAAILSTWPAPAGIAIPGPFPGPAASHLLEPSAGAGRDGPQVRRKGTGRRAAWAALAFLGLGVGFLVCLAGGAVSEEAGRAKNPPPIPASLAAAAGTVPWTAQPLPGRFRRIYTFDSPDELRDFEREGTARHLAGQGREGGGCVVFPVRGKIRLRLPRGILPLRVMYDVGRTAPHCWVTLDFPGLRQLCGFQILKEDLTGKGKWHTYSCFITEHALDHWSLFGHAVYLVESAQGVQELNFSGLQFRLDNLRLEQLTPAEVPDLRTFEEAFRRLGPGLPAGKEVPLPGFGGPGTRTTMAVF